MTTFVMGLVVGALAIYFRAGLIRLLLWAWDQTAGRLVSRPMKP